MSAHHRPDGPLAKFETREFRITEEDLDSACRQVRVEGELDLAVADQLRARLDAAAEEAIEVRVFLDRCDFIDSTGIAVLLMAREQLARKGRRLAICSPSDQVARTLEMTGLDLAGLMCTESAD